MAPSRKRCEVCGSKQWRKEPSTGVITCKEGHVLQNYRNETREMNDTGPHALHLKKRTLKSNRKRKGKQSRADAKLYHGERARFHHFQCLQLILRMQVRALTRLWELPSEYEVICRDVWALHLSLLPNPPPPEPYLYRQEQQNETEKDPPSKAPTNIGSEQNEDEDQEDDTGSAAEDQRSLSSSSSSSSSEDNENEDPELAELLRQASETPSSSSSDEDTVDRPDTNEVLSQERSAGRTRRRKRGRPNHPYDSPAGNLAVLVVACWILRLPLRYMDFIRAIEAYELSYLDCLRLLPANMTKHLTKQNVQALSPHHAPSVLHLHRLTSRLARLLYSSFHVYTPEMHAAPMLWRAVRCLHGTPTLYTLSKKLASILSIPMTLHHSLAGRLKRIKYNDPEYHRFDDAPVEVTLIAVVIIVLKLIYRLGEESRPVPCSDNDPIYALPDLGQCLELIQEDKQKASRSEEELLATDSTISALDVDDQLLDEYLDFCRLALLPREDHLNDRDAAAEFFPLQPAPSRTPHGPSEPDDMPPLSAQHMPQSDDAPHPGQGYKIYSSFDLLGALPVDYELVLGHAAKWCGVDENYISGAVQRFERRLCRWWAQVEKQSTSG